MAVNDIVVEVSPEAVFAVLADPRCYAEWVVGAQHSGPVDQRWPQPGSRFRHASGIGPLVIRDTTSVIASQPPGHLLLLVHARPLVNATVEITVAPHERGSLVTMREDIRGGIGRIAPRRLADAMLRRRNRTALERLRELAHGAAAGSVPANV
jgi:hypothetical protein